MASRTLYPPIVDTYTPLFIKKTNGEETTCRVWFSYSPYMSDWNNGSHYLQLIVNDQRTNKTVLNTSLWKLGMAVKEIFTPEENTIEFTQNLRYIEISDSDILDNFKTGTFYRVQLRLIDDTLDKNEVINNQSYINKNLDYFSEWSTVTLLRCIIQPIVYVSPGPNKTINSPLLNISGQIIFEENESETVQTCTLQLFKNDNKIEENTITMNYYDNSNSFNYKFKTLLDNGEYNIKISYLTKNGYKEDSSINPNLSYNITIKTDALEKPTLGNIKVLKDNDNGRVIISADSLTEQNLAIVRADSRTLFKTWEEIFLSHFSKDEKIYFEDKTIESGVWYKYNFQVINSNNGGRSAFPANYIAEPLMSNFSEIFLTQKEKQLKVTADGTVSSMSYNIQESKTDTIGSKYPWIRRNGAIQYRTFSFSGMISYTDNNITIQIPEVNDKIVEVIDKNINGLFYTKEELFQSNEIINLYENYNINNQICNYNDIILEKFFREKVIEFLLSEKPKLFRSLTEGNILVKLMNISFSPNTVTKGAVYNFNCDMVEIDSSSIENLDKYDIQKIGSISISPKPFEYEALIEKVGQINEN